MKTTQTNEINEIKKARSFTLKKMENKETNYLLILFFLLLALGLILISSVVIELITAEITYSNTEAKCYDNNNNLINNVSCYVALRCGIISKTINKDYCFKGLGEPIFIV